MNIKIALTIGAILLAAFAGWKVRDISAQRDFYAYKASQEAKLADALQKQDDIRAQAAKTAQKAEDDYQAEKDRLNQRYHDLLAQYDRLRTDRNTEPDHTEDQPPTIAARACPACPSRPSRAGELNLRQRQELLAIARDCDVIAAGRNALLKLYLEAAENGTLNTSSD